MLIKNFKLSDSVHTFFIVKTVVHYSLYWVKENSNSVPSASLQDSQYFWPTRLAKPLVPVASAAVRPLEAAGAQTGEGGVEFHFY